MNTVTKIGMLLSMLAALSLTACGSSNKTEADAEKALVEQTADLQVDEDLQESPSDSFSSDTDESSSFSNSDILDDDANLGASSSGVGH